METVTVSKSELMDIIKKNRTSHREIFEEAQEGYRKKVISILDKALNDARNGRKIQTYFNLEAPVDQTKDYDRAIRMLEMSVSDEIDLSENDFSQYVLDDWSWKREFLSNSALYTNL